MGHYRAREIARRLVTGGILLTVIVTTFLPGWATQAATTPVLADDSYSEATTTEGGVDRLPNKADQTELAPMNALIISEPGSAEALQRAVMETGGTIYIRQGDALFVGLDRLSVQELAPIGARAVYQGAVPESDLAALAETDRSAAETWNHMQNPELAVSDAPWMSSRADQDLLIIPRGEETVSSAGAHAPTDVDTSVFMVGSVNVEVVFVESATHKEDWTQDEINKIKGEVSSAFEWWTVAATAPDTSGELRPQAHLTWNVNYHSPLEDNKVEVTGVEPITKSIGEGMDTWIPQIASRYTGGAADETAARAWADLARDTAGTDWGLILYVVDSSSDRSDGGDGKFNDDLKIAGALNNGPWAVVSSMGMEGGLSNLEIIIAKMIGHVFGAGDETYNEALGCNVNEYYGYLSIQHTNCLSSGQSASLMRSGNAMITAYRNYQLSVPAREQVGWRDNDLSGVYDVMETVSANLSTLPDTAVCPYIHLNNITIENIPAEPLVYPDHGDINAGWWYSVVWNPDQGELVDGVYYHRININWAGYVWGRYNNGDWIGATPQGLAWDAENGGYSLILPGIAGTNNNDIEVVIMNRWEQQVDADASEVSIVLPWQATTPGDNNDLNAVEYFDANGSTPGNWTIYGAEAYTSVPGAELCFSFKGTEVTISHIEDDNGGTANVFVDGKLHSTIDYVNDELDHVIGGLADENHTVQLITSSAAGKVVYFDEFLITDSSTGRVIYGKDVVPIEADVDPNGFYEHSGAKIQYIGEWNPVDNLGNLPRQGTSDNQGKSSSRPLDRIYAYFTAADTVAIYRKVSPTGGTADVYLNGEYKATMQNYATKTMLTPYYISGLSPTVSYSLEIRINSAGDNQLIFDALRLLNLADSGASVHRVGLPSGDDLPEPLNIKARDGQEEVGSWTITASYIQSDEQGDVTNVYFQGSAITIRRDLGTSYRQMEVYVDGVLKMLLNNKGADTTNVPTTVHGLDPYLPHVLQIRLTNPNAGASALNRIRGFTIHYFETVSAGSYEEYEYLSGAPVRSDFIYDNTWAAPKKVTGPSGSHFIESSTRKSSVFLYFEGVDTVSVYGVVGTKYGAADIYVNGELKGRFTQKSSTTGYQRYVTITGLKLTPNVLEIRVNTTVANLPRIISLDRVLLYTKPVLTSTLVPGGIYDNDEMVVASIGSDPVPALQFSGQWKRASSGEAHDAWLDVVQHREDVLVFTVSLAASVTIYRRLASAFGMADVYVDGKLYTSFDSYSSAPNGVYQQPFEIVGLSFDFNHEIRIQPRVNGSKFTKFDIDYIVVGNNDAPDFLTEGKYEHNVNRPAIEYLGNWNKTGSIDWYSATRPGDRVMVTFRGNAFSTYFRRASNGGKVDVYIDGVRQQRVSTLSKTSVRNVPFSVSGLKKEMHTAEIVVVSGTVFIDAFEVYSAPALGENPIFNLVNPSEIIVLSGRWTTSGDYLRATEAGASIAVFVKNLNTMYIKREAKPGTFDVYVGGVKRVTVGNYVTLLGKSVETYVVSGLSMPKGTWIELRTRSTALVSISQLRFNLLGTQSSDCVFQAEDLTKGTAAGYWLKRPGKANNTNFYGGYQMVSQSQGASYYIGVQGIDYLTVWRALSPDWGNANIYLDGELWGIMPNYAAKVAYKVPFQVGPLPSDTLPHVIEFRQASKNPFGLDRFICGTTEVLAPDYYENQDLLEYSAYIGSWTNEVVTNASGGRAHRTAQKGARVSVRFEGNKLIIYRTTFKDGNLMTAVVDGVKYPINNKSSTTKYRVPYTILLPETAIHSLELMVTSGIVYFDALETGTAVPGSFGSYQENTPQVAVNDTVNNWTPTVSAYHSEGEHIITTRKNSNVMFLFYGRRVTTYMTRGKNWGKVHFFLDGKSLETIDLYATGSDSPFFAYDITGLTRGNHVLEVRFEGKKSKNGAARANIDVFSVDGAPVPRPDEVLPPGEPDTGDGGGGEEDVPTEGCFEEARQDVWTFEGDWNPLADGRASGWKNPDSEDPGGMYAVGSGPGTPLPGDLYAQFRFKASGFALLYHIDQFGAIANVYIDGMEVPVTTLDMYAPDPESWWIEDATLSRNDLDPNVVHVLRIAYKEAGDEYGNSRKLYIDRIDLPEYDPIYNDNCLAG